MTSTSEIWSDVANVRATRVDEAPVCALSVDSLVSVDDRWRRLW